MATPDILARIISHKKQEIKQDQQQLSLNEIKALAKKLPKSRGFFKALQPAQNQPAVIAEVKKASPSKGVLRKDFNPVAIALEYQQAGASCISVLTDNKFFQGKNKYLQRVVKATIIPILRKDFMIDPYQVYQAKVIGADCILLIASVLDFDQMKQLTTIAQSLNMDVLVEVHNQAELTKSLKLDLPMIGINNRNLHNFSTDLNTTIGLLNSIPAEIIVVTESGILQRQDVEFMLANGVNSFLVGEAFIKEPSPGKALQSLFFKN